MPSKVLTLYLLKEINPTKNMSINDTKYKIDVWINFGIIDTS